MTYLLRLVACLFVLLSIQSQSIEAGFPFSDIELNNFQNGQVADADKVNENFNNLKAALETINTIIEENNCYAHEGIPTNGSCKSPKIYLTDNILSMENQLVASFDTSKYVFKSSNYMQIELRGYYPTITCNLLDPAGSIIATVIFGSGNNKAQNVPIQLRGVHEFLCFSTDSANRFESNTYIRFTKYPVWELE